ncbi:unnamed protein product [Didymodactylos carnosus]|uniref:Uncharacterized protein n=1 Tax=Didymodactylos carnosus TaxID=1234261 RepID=A0A8S2S937_9BILA|nr:unnamed protein product [Didymodactylos carnosus]CAF4188790.1 unnamed protein product [Didymodactylos carnosus]
MKIFHLEGVLRTKLDIMRTVSGIALPVRCYIVDGKEVGSCTYPDLCALIKELSDTFTLESCAEELKPLGIDCTCPFNIPAQALFIEGTAFQVPDASQSAAKFLASGDFDVTVEAHLNNVLYGCGELHFSVQSPKPGK